MFDHPLIKHKEVGGNAKKVVVDAYTREMLVKLQNYLTNHQPNWPQLSQKYSHLNIDLRVFQDLLKELNPYITSHEAATLFAHFDHHKTGVVSWASLEKYLLSVDYRSSDDILSRKVD